MKPKQTFSDPVPANHSNSRQSGVRHKESVLFADESYQLIGACFEVYNLKGCGFLEAVYHDCLQVELGLRQIPYRHEPVLPLMYKGVRLAHAYTPDFTCWDKLILELKACDRIADEHVAQVINYLNATGYELGIVVNFGHHPGLEYKRVVRQR